LSSTVVDSRKAASILKSAPPREVPRFDALGPRCLEAEHAVLAAALLGPEAARIVAAQLSAADFGSPAFRRIHRAIAGLVAAGATPDLITVTDALRRSGDLEAVGGVDAVQALLDDPPPPGGFTAHVEIVRRDARLRRLVARAEVIAEAAREARVDPGTILSRAEDESDPAMRAVWSAVGESLDAGTARPVGLICVDAGTLLARAYPEPEAVLSPWLRQAQIAEIYSWRGTGKTWCAAGIACAVAGGGSFLRWKAANPRRVLLVDGEMPAAALQERIRSAAETCGIEPGPNLQIIAAALQPGGIPSLDTPQGQSLIERHLPGVELLILDSLSTLCRTGSRNDEEAWQPVQDWFARLRCAGVSVVFMHHAGKSGQQRGHSKVEDVADVCIALRRPADYRPNEGARFEVSFEKTRGFCGEGAVGFEARLETGPDGRPAWTTRTLEDAVRSRIVALALDGVSVTEIAAEVGLNKSNVSRRLAAARRDGLIGPAEGGK